MPDRTLQVWDLGTRAYRPVADLQERLVEERKAGVIPDTLILVEHEPVYTLGRNADRRHILVPESEWRRRGMDVVETSRGGDVTYHGPGQLVGYPILDLGRAPRRVVWYVSRLEEVLRRVLREFGVEGQTDRRRRGVWIGDDKVAALGVRITGGISMHGFALNVAVDPVCFEAIVPCGLAGRGVTSLHRLVPGLSMDAVKCHVRTHFRDVFGYAVIRDHNPLDGERLLG